MFTLNQLMITHENESQADVLLLLVAIIKKHCHFTLFLHHLSPKNVQVNA